MHDYIGSAQNVAGIPAPERDSLAIQRKYFQSSSYEYPINGSGRVVLVAIKTTDDSKTPYLPDLCRDQSVFFLILVAQLFVVLLQFANIAEKFDWQRLALLTLHVQWVCLVSAALICMVRQYIRFRPYWLQLSVALFIALLNDFVVSVAGQYLFSSTGFSLSVTLKHSLMTLLITSLVLRYFYLQQLLVRQSRSEAEARLQALQSRIRPHFLFNSLNTVASLIPVNPVAAEKAVEDLADLFRASLSDSSQWVTLKDELELCQRYLAIEQLRLEHRLRVEWQLALDPADWLVPQMSLQPLIENAVLHGIQQLPDGGIIEVSAAFKGDTLMVAVKNPVPATSTKVTKGNQMAVDNIRRRLLAMAGPEAALKLEQVDDSYYCRVIIPGARVTEDANE